MPSSTSLRLLAALVLGLAAPLASQAQERVFGRAYIVAADGEVRRSEEGRLVPVAAGDTFPLSGTALEVSPASTAAVLLSNNVGFVLRPETRLEVERFEQAPFVADPARMDDEPSASSLLARMRGGRLAACLPNPVFGSTTVLQVPHAVLNIRGRKVVTEVTDERTVVYVVDGVVTATRNLGDRTGVNAQSGQMLTIVPRAGENLPRITVEPIDPALTGPLNEDLALACLARNTVFFAAPDDPRRVVAPPTSDTNPTVSIDRLP